MTSRLLAALLVFLTMMTGEPALAQSPSPYDGTWSIMVVTERGDCGQAARYSLQIFNSQLFVATIGVYVSGQVTRKGAVTVSVMRGSDLANGTGKLNAETGKGRWTGRSLNGECRGYWVAEKRV